MGQENGRLIFIKCRCFPKVPENRVYYHRAIVTWTSLHRKTMILS